MRVVSVDSKTGEWRDEHGHLHNPKDLWIGNLDSIVQNTSPPPPDTDEKKDD